jgi:hypothetical protein
LSVAEQLGLSRPTVLALRDALAKDGCSVLRSELEQQIVDATVKTRPGDGSTHWSVRMLAQQLRVSRTIVHRLWQHHDVQPHRVEKSKLFSDRHFEQKVRRVVGLYLNPPERTLSVCVCTRKAKFQALDRTAPILPLRRGRPERQTHDYKRHGTTTLFAAFNILNGKVIGTCRDRHRGRDFIRFLNYLEAELPPDREVHLIMDNYGNHKSAEVQRWMKPKKRKGSVFTSHQPAVRNSTSVPRSIGQALDICREAPLLWAWRREAQKQFYIKLLFHNTVIQRLTLSRMTPVEAFQTNGLGSPLAPGSV